jgi:phage-related protein
MQALVTPMIMLGMKKYKPYVYEVLGAEQCVNWIRVLFAASVAGVLLTAALLYWKTKSKNDKTPLVVKRKKPGQ